MQRHVAFPEADSFNKRFGERMRQAREDRGMTQQDLADALRVTIDKVKKQELGETAFPIYLLGSLAKVLGKSPSWLLIGRD